MKCRPQRRRGPGHYHYHPHQRRAQLRTGGNGRRGAGGQQADHPGPAHQAGDAHPHHRSQKRGIRFHYGRPQCAPGPGQRVQHLRNQTQHRTGNLQHRGGQAAGQRHGSGFPVPRRLFGRILLVKRQLCIISFIRRGQQTVLLYLYPQGRLSQPLCPGFCRTDPE